jgi:hypothetical protein
LKDSEHPLVLRVEGYFEDTRECLSEAIARGAICSEAEDSAVGGVTLNGTLVEGEVVGGRVEGCIVAEKGGTLKSSGRLSDVLAVKQVLELIRRVKLLVDKGN